MSFKNLNRRTFLRGLAGVCTAALLAGAANPVLAAEPKKNFRMGWSIYAGWMP